MQAKSNKKPYVLMPMGSQVREDIDYQVMTHKYMTPMVRFSKCQPILIPTCFDYTVDDLDDLLDIADGVYLSGASTNVDPMLYHQENLTPEKRQDRPRDLFDLALIKRALERGLPLLGICRGMQELNVAYGGTLHQKAYTVNGFHDHREDSEAPPNVMYEKAHLIHLEKGTWFHDMMKTDDFSVNSLHGQAIDKLGEGLAVLAHADDGLIEAIYAEQYPQFSLAVQWHPEWKTHEDPQSIKMFEAFGQACHQFMNEDRR